MRDLTADETRTLNAVVPMMRAVYTTRVPRPTEGEWSLAVILATMGVRAGTQVQHYRAAFDTQPTRGHHAFTGLNPILIRAIELAATDELFQWLRGIDDNTHTTDSTKEHS